MGPWVGGVVDLGSGCINAHVFFYLHVLVDPKLCLSNINLNPIPIDAGLRWPPRARLIPQLLRNVALA